MAMATPSSLISKLHSVLHSPNCSTYPQLKLRMGLRSLQVLLVCLRYLGDDKKIPHAMQSLFSRIEDAIGRASTNADYSVIADHVSSVNCLAEEVVDECERHNITISNHLTLDDVVEVADSLLDCTADFWKVVEACLNEVPNAANLRDAMSGIEVQVRFLRDFLLFSKQAGADIHQIQYLLIHVRPFVLDASRMFFIQRTPHMGSAYWIEELESKCPKVDPQIFRSYTQTLLSITKLDQTNDAVLKEFLSSLISLLWHGLRYQHHHPSLKALYGALRSLLKQCSQSSEADFAGRIGVQIRDAGIVICYKDVDLPYLSDLLQRFDVVQPQKLPDSNSLKENVLDFGDTATMEEISDDNVQVNPVTAIHQSICTPQDAGFQEYEVASILDRLLGGAKQLRLVPISGMVGIGKTTFALKVYNHPSVIYRFQARAWCTISQVLDKKRVLLQLLDQIQPGVYSSMMTEDDLANKLRQSLKRKRYVIFLDDVWSPRVYESLRLSFPDDGTQSRMVLTSRFRAIVPHALHDEQPYFLRMRTENECLEIIEIKLLPEAKRLRTKLENFAKLCKGLPLTAVLLAGILATTVQQGWDKILEHLKVGGLSDIEQCKTTLEFSYKQLSDDLKLCFIYFGVFPEDEEIYAHKLIRLWMAEGFVARASGLSKKRAKDVAREYLDNLIQRNLVMVAKKRSICGVKCCHIHDLLHDFCLMKGKKDSLFHRLQQTHDELSYFNEPCNLGRLSIHSTAPHFRESKLFCPLTHSMFLFPPMMTTYEDRFLSDMLFIIQIYKHLRVLDMDRIWFTDEVPSEIALLTQLTYLSICCRGNAFPSSIGSLSNLETLITNFIGTEWASLPHTIWNLHKLKHFRIAFDQLNACLGFSFPDENLENSPNLLDLDSVCGVLFYSNEDMEKQMRKLPNIHRLKCHVLCGGEKELNKIVVVPKFLSRLELLTLSTENGFHCQFDFGSTAKNIRKVTLNGFVLSRGEIAVMGELPKLEVLKLEDTEFLSGSMEMEEGEFLQLRVLAFRNQSNLQTWTTTGDETLPCLEKLIFLKCKELKEIPDYCLETSSTLEEIQVFACSRALESLVRNIEEVQNDFGNLIRVQISRETDADESEKEFGLEEEKSEEEE